MLRDKARQWALDVKKIHDTDVPPNLVGEKIKLIERAKTIKGTLESVLGTVDELAPMNFGFLPLIGAGAIGAAGAAIAAWYVGRNAFVDKLGAYDKLRQQGITHKEAMQVVDSKHGVAAGFLGGLSLPVMIGGGILAFILLRKSFGK
jgi:hypothetical protein